MTRTRARGAAFAGLSALTAAALLDACGSRTGLPFDEAPVTAQEDARPDAHKGDAARDVTPDVPEEDLPPLDARPRDARRDDCPDADATLVYLVSDANDLLSFYPPTLSFTHIGKLVCPVAGGQTPFSMAVDRKGKAYVVYTDGRLYQVSTATAACIALPFVPNQRGFFDFGMGFVSNAGGPDETLFVAQSPSSASGNSLGLGKIDTTTFKLDFVGPFAPPLQRVEFTGTGDGRLFGYAPNDTSSKIVEIDKTTGAVVASDPVAAGSSQDAFAFAFWGGDFWIFTVVTGNSPVYRYRPADKTTVHVATAPSRIVGAGVSTCAPQ